MNPGKMDKWLTVTAFDAAAGVYKKVRNAYGAYQYKSRVVLSPHSAALPGAEIITRRIGTVRGSGLTIGGKDYIVADVDDTDRGNLTLTAAAVRLLPCNGTRTESVTGTLNRAENKKTALPDFVAVLSEKYIAHDQQAANAELRTEQVLITAKAVDLRSGDDVTVDGVTYTVMTAHTADDGLNEYIVLRVEDA